MSKININPVTYPKPNTETQICINNYIITNTTIDLQDKEEDNNINFDLSFNYIDYNIPGNVFEISTSSLKLNNTNIPYAFSDVVSLCKLQTDILAQLFYVPVVWNSSTIYNINTIVSYTINDLTYTFMSLIDNTLTGSVNNAPDLRYNYWQLQEYSSVGMADINNPTSEKFPYPFGYQIYYNQNYYNANSSTPIATPSKRGIYTCITPTWTTGVSYNTEDLVYYTPSEGALTLYISTIDNNTTTPGTSDNNNWEPTVDNTQPPIIRNPNTNVLSFNTTYWILQTWNSEITYMKNYIVYYTPSGGILTLYISLEDNNINNIPSSTSTFWYVTTL